MDIADVAKRAGVPASTLRFYEQKGLLHPARRGWTRLFSYCDRARLQLILRGKKVGFSLEEIKLVVGKELDVRSLREENRSLREALEAALPVPGLPISVTAVPFRGAAGTGSVLVMLQTPPGAVKFVDRGDKLEGALRDLSVPVDGATALDVGASTGGFTDCLLRHGARKVYAVDVGRGQLHERLRGNPRVVVRERVNARALSPEVVPEPCSLAVMDVSFISVRKKPGAMPLTRMP